MRSRKGQGTVEFALISVLLFTVFCAIIEFSWVAYNIAYLNNAVSKAARQYIATDTSQGFGTSAAAQQLLVGERGGLDIASSQVDLLDANFVTAGSRSTATFVKVSATMNYPSITPLNNFVQYAGLGTLRAESIARIE